MRSRVLWCTYETQSWSVKGSPVLEQTSEPETKDEATLRTSFFSLSLSLLPGCFKCCEQAMILSLAGLKQPLREPTCNKTPFTSRGDSPSAKNAGDVVLDCNPCANCINDSSASCKSVFRYAQCFLVVGINMRGHRGCLLRRDLLGKSFAYLRFVVSPSHGTGN